MWRRSRIVQADNSFPIPISMDFSRPFPNFPRSLYWFLLTFSSMIQRWNLKDYHVVLKFCDMFGLHVGPRVSTQFAIIESDRRQMWVCHYSADLMLRLGQRLNMLWSYLFTIFFFLMKNKAMSGHDYQRNSYFIIFLNFPFYRLVCGAAVKKKIHEK